MKQYSRPNHIAPESMNSVSSYHRQYLPTRNRFLSRDRSFHRRQHARNGFLGSPSPIFLRFREERDDTRGIPSYPSGINSGLRSSPLTSSIQLKPSPFTSRNKDKRQNGFEDVLASPLKGISPPRPRHLGFATPLSSSSRRHDHFSPFFRLLSLHTRLRLMIPFTDQRSQCGMKQIPLDSMELFPNTAHL